MNLTCGGLLGYCSSNCITRRKVPSSKGVSAGPIITAFLCQGSRALANAWSLVSPPRAFRGYKPCHDIVGYGRGRDASGRVCLHALFAKCVSRAFRDDFKPRLLEWTNLEVAHQAASGGGRHCDEDDGEIVACERCCADPDESEGLSGVG